MSTNNAPDVNTWLDEILDRIRSVAGISSDSALSRVLGAGRSSVATWKKRGTIPCMQLIEFANDHDLSLDWLFFGIGRQKISTTMGSYGVAEELPPDFSYRLKHLEDITQRVMHRVERRTNQADPLRLGKLRDLAFSAQLTDQQIDTVLDLLEEAAMPQFWISKIDEREGSD